MGDCLKTYGKKDLNSLTKLRIENFCSTLERTDKHKSKKAFLALPVVVQCMFLHHGHQVLTDPKKYSEKSYQQSVKLFKIFQGEGGKDVETYKKYRKFVIKTEEKKVSSSEEEEKPPVKVSKKKSSSSESSAKSSSEEEEKPKPKKPPTAPAKRANTKRAPVLRAKSTGASKSKSTGTSKRTKKTYDKEYQKYEEASDDTDPLYIFYSTLYDQKPKSRLAITWLTEHGVYEGDSRDELVKKYKKLAEKGELIK